MMQRLDFHSLMIVSKLSFNTLSSGWMKTCLFQVCGRLMNLHIIVKGVLNRWFWWYGKFIYKYPYPFIFIPLSVSWCSFYIYASIFQFIQLNTKSKANNIFPCTTCTDVVCKMDKFTSVSSGAWPKHYINCVSGVSFIRYIFLAWLNGATSWASSTEI